MERCILLSRGRANTALGRIGRAAPAHCNNQLLVQGNASWVAPGHNAVITYNGKTYNLYHALRGSSSGPATLRVSELVWDSDGWPVSGGP